MIVKKLIAYTAKMPRLRLEIEEDINVGFYFMVYPEVGKESLADYLQDSLQSVFEYAKEKYGIPPEDWTSELD